jgi:hypothetical protein
MSTGLTTRVRRYLGYTEDAPQSVSVVDYFKSDTNHLGRDVSLTGTSAETLR